MEDSFCTKCMHHDCSVGAPNCPTARDSPRWCDYCNEERETVPAHPDDSENYICGNCHPSGTLPDTDEWWEDEDESSVKEPEDTCPNCNEPKTFTQTVSCSNCGFIPSEHVDTAS